jgi:hypothetical protein
MYDTGNTATDGDERPPRRRSLLRDVSLTAAIGIAILGLVVAINWDPGGDGDTWSVVPYVGGVATDAAPQVGSPAPDFEISYFRVPVQGEAEMPDIQEVWEEVKGQDFFLLSVDFGEAPETAAEYVANNGLTFPIGLDPSSRLVTEYRLAGLPTHVFIDANGIVREIRIGLLNVDGMRQRLEKLKEF